MCGIFGIISTVPIPRADIRRLAHYSESRGKDASGLLTAGSHGYELHRADMSITSLLKAARVATAGLVIGHSRLITNGFADNQPVYRDGVFVIHNGIVVNHEELWGLTTKKRYQEIDTEIIAAITAEYIESGGLVDGVSERVLGLCKGIVACAVAIPRLGKICLFSNNGSLFYGIKNGAHYFASERYVLAKIKCSAVNQVRTQGIILDIPASDLQPFVHSHFQRSANIVPSLGADKSEEPMLEYNNSRMKRCTRCILPETVPFIQFDSLGICNYCNSYQPRNTPKPRDELIRLVESYRRVGESDCIVPFSGGRDSSYGLHLIVKELRMRPIAYTYDWGMVTDLGRRNISRMCAALGVENIVVADDIINKRRNIAMNLKAWLKSPHLGMVSILTAGDKHFFRHVETVKRHTGISLNLWGINPLELTHFKAGFLGVPPDFAEERVYSHGALKQFRYQCLRLSAMSQSLGYFNSSLWDTLSGEYFRSFSMKSNYYHIFDYWRWEENTVNEILINQYDWETAPDTNSTWRIGDGTAAMYNYIYHTVAGFTEHDTFRSNQIREGDLSRDEALSLVQDENRPRYPNIKWYLEALGMDFRSVISVINAIPRLCEM